MFYLSRVTNATAKVQKKMHICKLFCRKITHGCIFSAVAPAHACMGAGVMLLKRPMPAKRHQ